MIAGDYSFLRVQEIAARRIEALVMEWMRLNGILDPDLFSKFSIFQPSVNCWCIGDICRSIMSRLNFLFKPERLVGYNLT